METAIVKSEAEAPQAPIAAEKRLTVFARNPQEMSIAQAQLVKWTLAKMGEIHGEEDDLRDNLAVAEKNGWRTVTLKRQLARTAKRLAFYEKVKAALEAGYCIVPNFPIDVFAVRTNRSAPTANLAVNKNGWTPGIQNQRSESPPLGDGAFVAATAAVSESREQYTDKEGKEHTKIERWASEYQEVDFPFAFAQPAVLEATQRAVVDRIFDELGVSPASAARRTRGDPMVIGRIYAPHTPYNRDTRSLSFVVAWFLRPDRDLDF